MPGVDVGTSGPVATLVIDNMAHRNALSDAVLAQLVAAAVEADEDPEVRCIVVAGSEKVFASGADVRALLERSPTDIYDDKRSRGWRALRSIRTPMVAAVSGFCLGGGCELAMYADVVIASETARFGLPETQLGLIPGAGGTQLLPRAIGRAKAMDMILTGRLLDAAEAERDGLVSRVVAAGEWLDVAHEVARTIAARPAVAQRLAKETVRQAAETPLGAGVAAERRAFAMAFATHDAREGMEAFVAKRKPTWRHG
ncbi:MAG: enoyl-CoA hydratase-related protein [Solirubrobacteraceae bacterium]